jgi:hypothetical protein
MPKQEKLAAKMHAQVAIYSAMKGFGKTQDIHDTWERMGGKPWQEADIDDLTDKIKWLNGLIETQRRIVRKILEP